MQGSAISHAKATAPTTTHHSLVNKYLFHRLQETLACLRSPANIFSIMSHVWIRPGYQPQDANQIPCVYYNQTGVCRDGANCRFKHERESAPRQPCIYYQRGYCSRGTACLFAHTLPVVTPVAQPSNDLRRDSAMGGDRDAAKAAADAPTAPAPEDRTDTKGEVARAPTSKPARGMGRGHSMDRDKGREDTGFSMAAAAHAEPWQPRLPPHAAATATEHAILGASSSSAVRMLPIVVMRGWRQ